MFFKKKKKVEYGAFASGTLIPLESVQDPVFSAKMIGDGFAIEPSTGEIVSPCDGTISLVFPTKHALGVKTSTGIEILLHLGIDTVNLDGEGFEVLVELDDTVKSGQPIARMDLDFIKNSGKFNTSMMIFTTGEKIEILKSNQEVVAGESDIINVL